MGDWRHMGQGMRRRMGAPMNTLGSVTPGFGAVKGSGMDSDIAQAVASMTQYGRAPMGVNPLDTLIDDTPFAPSANEKLVAKHQMKLSDPAIVPGAQPRTPMMAERLGAHYSVQADVSHPNPLPEAGQTQRNARVIPPVVKRSMDAFQGGMLQP